jgi:hypothetical protein
MSDKTQANRRLRKSTRAKKIVNDWLANNTRLRLIHHQGQMIFHYFGHLGTLVEDKPFEYLRFYGAGFDISMPAWDSLVEIRQEVGSVHFLGGNGERFTLCAVTSHGMDAANTQLAVWAKIGAEVSALISLPTGTVGLRGTLQQVHGTPAYRLLRNGSGVVVDVMFSLSGFTLATVEPRDNFSLLTLTGDRIQIRMADVISTEQLGKQSPVAKWLN